MQKLNDLQKRRKILLRMEERNNQLFGSQIDHDRLPRMLYEIEHEKRLEHLEQEIQQAEEEAFAEQAHEVREATLKELSDAGSQAGKELAAAIEKGFNSRK